MFVMDNTTKRQSKPQISMTQYDSASGNDSDQCDSDAEEDVRKAAQTFLKAVEDGDRAKVLRMFEPEFQLNAVNEDGLTSLMLASKHGHDAIAYHLWHEDADMMQTDKAGNTALYWAVQGSHQKTAVWLIRKMLECNQKAAKLVFDIELRHAVKQQLLTVVEQLLEAEADAGWAGEDGVTTLWMAAQRGHFEMIRLLLAGNKKLEFDSVHQGVTPLGIAVRERRSIVAQMLILRGFSPDLDRKSLDSMDRIYLEKCVDMATFVTRRRMFEQLIRASKSDDTLTAEKILSSIRPDDAFILNWKHEGMTPLAWSEKRAAATSKVLKLLRKNGSNKTMVQHIAK